MRRLLPLISLLALVLLAVAPAGLRYVNYYGWGGSSARPAPPKYTAANVPDVGQPTTSRFVDAPTVGSGMVLLDMAHNNQFAMAEIASLNGRLAARGYHMVPYRTGNLARQLRGASAFVVMTPLKVFSDEEVLAVVDFVQRGGRLLLVGDPARFQVGFVEDSFGFVVDYRIETAALPLNTLANEFDLLFEGDYLYNLEESEGNFRNIIMKQGQLQAESPITADLTSVAFYGSHSIRVGAGAVPLLQGGSTTYSSATDRAGGLVLGALGGNGRVLALGDINFLTEPYHTSFDNPRLIAQIADFLVQGEREYVLTDFPYFYDQTDIDLVYVGEVDLGADAFDEIISLQDAFRKARRNLWLTAVPASGQTLYLGLYNQALTQPEVMAWLAEAELTLVIDPPLLTEAEKEALAEAEAEQAEIEEPAEEVDEEAEEVVEEEAEPTPTPTPAPKVTQQLQSRMGNVQLSGTALLLYRETDNGRELLLLAASKEGLENSIERLFDLMPLNSTYALADCLTTNSMALCPTSIADELLEAELLTGGVPPVPEEEEAQDNGSTPPSNDENNGSADDDLFQFTIDDLDPPPVEQGEIGLDESVTATLPEGETHLWIYSGTDTTVDISLVGDELFDGVIEIYNERGVYVDYKDSTFSGDEELLVGLAIADGYMIVVQEYFGDGGEYTLSVLLSDEANAGQNGSEVVADENATIQTIFLYLDDTGRLAEEAPAALVAMAPLLSAYEVEVWSAAEATTPLTEEDLEGYDLIIWYSGLYRNTELFGGDTLTLMTVLFEGGKLLMMGATPPLFEPSETAALVDVEWVGDDALLLAGLEAGDVWTLTAAYQTTVVPELLEDLDPETDTLFLVRGSNSNEAGEPVGVAVRDEDAGSQFIVLFLPLEAVPASNRAQLLSNLIGWFS